MAKYVTLGGNDFFEKSLVLQTERGAVVAENSAIIALYAYGDPYQNGSAADTPKKGFSQYDRDYKILPKEDGGPPYDILNMKTNSVLRHQKTYYTEASKFVGVVYIDEKTGDVYVGFKGSADFDQSKFAPYAFHRKDKDTTQQQSSQADADWQVNKDQQLGSKSFNYHPSESLPAQYRDAESMLRKVLMDYPQSRIYPTAHSKGGGELQYAMMANQALIKKHKSEVTGFAFDPPPLNVGQDDLKERGLIQNVSFREAGADRAFAEKHIQIFQVDYRRPTRNDNVSPNNF